MCVTIPPAIICCPARRAWSSGGPCTTRRSSRHSWVAEAATKVTRDVTSATIAVMSELPLLHLQGSPYRQGVHHGRRLRDRIANNIEVYRSRMLASGLRKRDLAERSRHYLGQFTGEDAV